MFNFLSQQRQICDTNTGPKRGLQGAYECHSQIQETQTIYLFHEKSTKREFGNNFKS